MVEKRTLIIGLIIIIAILAVVTCFLVAGDMFANSDTELNLTDSCSCLVPASHSANLNEKDNVHAYEDSEHNLTVVAFNTKSSSGADLMNNVLNSSLVGAVQVINGTSVHFDKKTGMYSIFVGSSATHDDVLIISKDLDLLLKVYNSLKFDGTPIGDALHITHDTSMIKSTTNCSN